MAPLNDFQRRSVAARLFEMRFNSSRDVRFELAERDLIHFPDGARAHHLPADSAVVHDAPGEGEARRYFRRNEYCPSCALSRCLPGANGGGNAGAGNRGVEGRIILAAWIIR